MRRTKKELLHEEILRIEMDYQMDKVLGNIPKEDEKSGSKNTPKSPINHETSTSENSGLKHRKGQRAGKNRKE